MAFSGAQGGYTMPTWVGHPLGGQQIASLGPQHTSVGLTTWSQEMPAGQMQDSFTGVPMPDPSIPSVAEFMEHERAKSSEPEGATSARLTQGDGAGTAPGASVPPPVQKLVRLEAIKDANGHFEDYDPEEIETHVSVALRKVGIDATIKATKVHRALFVIACPTQGIQHLLEAEEIDVYCTDEDVDKPLQIYRVVESDERGNALRDTDERTRIRNERARARDSKRAEERASTFFMVHTMPPSMLLASEEKWLQAKGHVQNYLSKSAGLRKTPHVIRGKSKRLGRTENVLLSWSTLVDSAPATRSEVNFASLRRIPFDRDAQNPIHSRLNADFRTKLGLKQCCLLRECIARDEKGCLSGKTFSQVHGIARTRCIVHV